MFSKSKNRKSFRSEAPVIVFGWDLAILNSSRLINWIQSNRFNLSMNVIRYSMILLESCWRRNVSITQFKVMSVVLSGTRDTVMATLHRVGHRLRLIELAHWLMVFGVLNVPISKFKVMTLEILFHLKLAFSVFVACSWWNWQELVLLFSCVVVCDLIRSYFNGSFLKITH